MAKRKMHTIVQYFSEDNVWWSDDLGWFDRDKIEPDGGFCTCATFRRIDDAFKSSDQLAKLISKGTISVTRFWFKNGVRWSQEFERIIN